MKKVIALLVILCSAADYACADNLIIGEYTHHFKIYPCKGCAAWEDNNPLIGYSTDKYTFVAMKNSIGNNSALALRNFGKDFGSNLTGYASVGVGTGYTELPNGLDFGGLTALGYLNLNIHPKSDKFGLLITYAPHLFIGVGLRFKIGD